MIQQSLSVTLSIVSENWKYITPSHAPGYNPSTNIELGQDTIPQLYNLAEDPGEKNNIAGELPEKVKELTVKLESLK